MSPVPLTSHVWSAPSAQSEPSTDPLRPGLSARSRTCSVAGKEGSGFVSSLLSRWSSTRAVRDETEDGMVPVMFVEEKSLKIWLAEDERGWGAGTHSSLSEDRTEGLLNSASSGFVSTWFVITLIQMVSAVQLR